MRPHAAVTSAGGLPPVGHLGWGYRGRADFDARAAEYLADGLAQDLWIEYVGDETTEVLEAQLAAVSGGAEAMAQGRAGVRTTSDFYVFDGADDIDPAASLERRAAATADALERGFAGFRGIVDSTAVSRTAGQRAAVARFEQYVDREMASSPVSAMCAYDLDVLEGDAEHNALLALEACAESNDLKFQLVRPPAIVEELVRLLGLRRVSV